MHSRGLVVCPPYLLPLEEERHWLRDVSGHDVHGTSLSMNSPDVGSHSRAKRVKYLGALHTDRLVCAWRRCVYVSVYLCKCCLAVCCGVLGVCVIVMWCLH